MIGRPITELTVGPEDTQVAENIMDCVRRTGRWEGEFWVRRRDGTAFLASVREATIADEHGTSQGRARVSSIAAANCEVARMLADRLGLPASVGALFVHLMERWDGRGTPGDVRGEEVPLALRIAHVARDADAQRELGGADRAADVMRARAGGAFDPAIATLLADDADAILSLEGGASAWDATLACEPGPRLTLEGEAIDGALSAMGDFADLASPLWGSVRADAGRCWSS